MSRRPSNKSLQTESLSLPQQQPNASLRHKNLLRHCEVVVAGEEVVEVAAKANSKKQP
jgi:hypothetical protein